MPKCFVERLQVTGSVSDWLGRCKVALEAAGFEQIRVIDILRQVTACYRTIIIAGTIEVTLEPDGSTTTIHVTTMAQTNRCIFLLRNPAKRMMATFLRELGESR